MYIANQANNRISKIEDVEIHSTYSPEVRAELREINVRISNKLYNYGNTEKMQCRDRKETKRILN